MEQAYQLLSNQQNNLINLINDVLLGKWIFTSVAARKEKRKYDNAP